MISGEKVFDSIEEGFNDTAVLFGLGLAEGAAGGGGWG